MTRTIAIALFVALIFAVYGRVSVAARRFLLLLGAIGLGALVGVLVEVMVRSPPRRATDWVALILVSAIPLLGGSCIWREYKRLREQP